jgi:hypothetical protein
MRSTQTRFRVLLRKNRRGHIGRVKPIGSGPHGPEITGKTGVWYFSTRRKIPSKVLSDHVDALVGLIFPFGDQDRRLRELCDIMERENLKAHATFFWRGPSDAKRPSVSHVATEPLHRLRADIEVDFATE